MHAQLACTRSKQNRHTCADVLQGHWKERRPPKLRRSCCVTQCALTLCDPTRTRPRPSCPSNAVDASPFPSFHKAHLDKGVDLGIPAVVVQVRRGCTACGRQQHVRAKRAAVQQLAQRGHPLYATAMMGDRELMCSMQQTAARARQTRSCAAAGSAGASTVRNGHGGASGPYALPLPVGVSVHERALYLDAPDGVGLSSKVYCVYTLVHTVVLVRTTSRHTLPVPTTSRHSRQHCAYYYSYLVVCIHYCTGRLCMLPNV